MIKNLLKTLSPNKKLTEVNEKAKKLTEVPEKTDFEDGNTQTPSIQNIGLTQSIRYTLTLMNRSRNLFKIIEKLNGDLFWNGIHTKQFRENGNTIKDE